MDNENHDAEIAPHVWAMVELINNDNERIDWAYWAAKMPRWTAYQAVRLMAALDPGKHPDLSFKRNETAGAAKEHAKRLELLAASHRMTEATPAEWLQWADGLSESVHVGLRVAVERQLGIGATPADEYELRYQAIGEDARFALFNVAELAAWASANKVAVPFLKLLITDEHTDIPPERRFQPCGTLPLSIAMAYVPVDMDAHEAQAALLGSGAPADDGDPVGRLRDRIAMSYERQLLNAVYDGKLTIYENSTYAPVDLTAARLRWVEKAIPPAAQRASEASSKAPSGEGGRPDATTTNRIRNRTNPLDAVIERAKREAENADDYHSVWAALVKIALRDHRPAPLIGYADGEGVKWDDSGNVKFFTKDALRKRMNPSAR
ncbi:hypothetical protein WI84_13880 [Burkholderia ubonensis]|uniref:hypothetical protein n=1 Tax=Burkholderia ubonensis TaxID=101571 RepID=UPI00075D0D64|nr:hypothetical protein [Burkholderia ubonensis]KVD37566.1 hypothetical protein WI84_13880 [Burkholderia ubonensis]